MLNCRTNGRRGLGRLLKRLLDGAETGLLWSNWSRKMMMMMMMMMMTLIRAWKEVVVISLRLKSCNVLNLQHTKQEDVNYCITTCSFHLRIMTLPLCLSKHIQSAEKLHAQTSWGDRRDQMEDLLSRNWMSDTRLCSATDCPSGSA